MTALVAQEPAKVMLIYIGGAMPPASSLLPLSFHHLMLIAPKTVVIPVPSPLPFMFKVEAVS